VYSNIAIVICSIIIVIYLYETWVTYYLYSNFSFNHRLLQSSLLNPNIRMVDQITHKIIKPWIVCASLFYPRSNFRRYIICAYINSITRKNRNNQKHKLFSNSKNLTLNLIIDQFTLLLKWWIHLQQWLSRSLHSLWYV